MTTLNVACEKNLPTIVLATTADDAAILRAGVRVGYPLVVTVAPSQASAPVCLVSPGPGAARELLDAVYDLRKQGKPARLAPACLVTA